MRSLKGTLYRRAVTGTSAILLVAGTILYVSVDRQLVRQMDESLADKARTLSLSIEEKHYGLEVDLEEMREEVMEEAESEEYISVEALDGRIIYQSGIFEGISLPGVSIPQEESLHEWQIIKGAGRLRSVIITFRPAVDDEEEDLESVAMDPGLIIDHAGEPGDLVVLRLFKHASQHESFMHVFLLMLLATGLGSIGILSLTLWMTIKRGAQPINELASRIEAIRDDDLAVRLNEVDVLKELIPIVRKLNLFLDRLEGSFSRERSFTSDAAHELRTPLAGLKSTIEVALARNREDDEYRETLAGALVMVKQLENLVKSLLTLARLESGQESPKGSTIMLEDRIMDAWMTCREAVEAKQIRAFFEFSNGSSAVIDGDLFTQVLEELFRNAVYYVENGGSVRIKVHQDDDGRMRIKIGNTGSRISAEEAGHVFDRFWRGSHARDDTGVRFGLGLPIARKIAETLGVDIKIESEMGGEFAVTLIMPAQA